ncbi:MAG: hypothetical protein M3483_07840 [Gemmatimonadota bacterium]|nr:hypothetical protein [Gemmatimonadota bacterium]
MATWHVFTGEYPPQIGGVSDFSYLISWGLAAAGDEVHVWCPLTEADTPEAPGVVVHQELGTLTPSDLLRAGRVLDRFPGPRRIFVQWVPHSYGYRSLNLPFCVWLLARARFSRDEVQVMVHEPYLGFKPKAWRQNAAAAVHRLMTVVLLRAARKVWVSTPLWAERWRPYTLGRRVPFEWLPIPSNIPLGDPVTAAMIRARHAPAAGDWLIGHFGTYGRPISHALHALIPELLAGAENRTLLLLGRGSLLFEEELVRLHPELEGQVLASGPLSSESLAAHLLACDLMVQPYPGGGVNARRSSVMAVLKQGVAVVTDRGILTETFWTETGGAALVTAEGPTPWKSEVDALLRDDARRARLAGAGRALYQSRFAIEHAVAALRGEP